jgi:hypothetical protein
MRKNSLSWFNSGSLGTTIFVVLLWGLSASLASAGTFSVFGKTYVRQNGAPVTVTDTFSVYNPNAPYTLHIQNSGISSALVLVNGVQILGPSDFDPNVTSIDRAVSVTTSNSIAVQLRSAPGSSLVISIIGIDNDPPVIVASASPSPNAAGWNNTSVVVTFSCSDKTSGVASCPSPVTVSTEGANQVISGTAADRAGNTASTSITLNIEKTPPSITASATPPPNGAGWNNSDVTVSFLCGASLSGRVQCPGPQTVSTEGANQRITGTLSDVAGNNATAAATVNLDKTPPLLTITSPASGFVSNASTISVSGTATDALSGVATIACNGAPASLSGPSFTCSVSLNAGGNTIAVSVSDVAGNTTSTTLSVTFGNPTAPAAPTALTARPDIGQMLLTWTASPGAAGYKVKRSTTSGGPYTMVGISTSSSFVDTEVVGNTTYYYVATAVNAQGESPNSNEAHQTTLDTGPGTTIQDATGGTVNVADPQNPNSIVTIVIPSGVMGTTSDTISVAFSDNSPGPLNANATAAGAHFVSRVITLTRASGLEFIKPIHVTIPYDLSQVGPNDSLIVVYWDESENGYDVVDTFGVDRVNGTITFQTVHFSQYRTLDFPVLFPPLPPSAAQALDTGFRAFTDGFSVANIESMTGAADGGACFGLTAFAKWFYQTEVPIQATRLASNPLFNQPSRAEDDVARELMYWGYTHTLQENIDLTWLDKQSPSDAATANDLVAALLATNNPQLVVLALNGSYQAPTDVHSVLVYSYSTDTTANVIHFYFYDPNAPLSDYASNNPLRGQRLDYIINAGSFYLPAYTDPFGRGFSWVYFSALSDFFRPLDFIPEFDDASNGWPDSKRKFNEIAIDQGSSTGLNLVSPDGPDPVANPAVYNVLPGSTTFAMKWTPNPPCPCPKPDGTPRTQAYAHIFFDGVWKGPDIPLNVPLSSTGLPTSFSYTLPSDVGGTANGTEMIVIISDYQYNPNTALPYDLDYYLSQGYEGFLRIKLKPPLYQVTTLILGALADATDYPNGLFPYTDNRISDSETCYSPGFLQSQYGFVAAPFSANFPLACAGNLHRQGASFVPPSLISPPVFSDSLTATLGSAVGTTNFGVQFTPNSISWTASWLSTIGDPCSPPTGFFCYINGAGTAGGISIQVAVYAPVHYHIVVSCSSDDPPAPPPSPQSDPTCGVSDVSVGDPTNGTKTVIGLTGVVDGVFSTYNNAIVASPSFRGLTYYYLPKLSGTGTLSLSITLTP